MKLNNKGITLVEIIVSVALISIVLLLLFTLLIQVNNENSDNEVNSSYLILQSTFIKQVEEDFLDYGLVRGEVCDESKINDEVNTTTSSEYLYVRNLSDKSKVKCLKFTYNDETYDYAYLFIYPSVVNRKTRYNLAYYRGDFRKSQVLEGYVWSNESPTVEEVQCKNGNTFVPGCFYKHYKMPLIGSDNRDYSINLSYVVY